MKASSMSVSSVTLPRAGLFLPHQLTQTRDAGVGVQKSDGTDQVGPRLDLQHFGVDDVGQTVGLRDQQGGATQHHQART